jgi:hypothetical protein
MNWSTDGVYYERAFILNESVLAEKRVGGRSLSKGRNSGQHLLFLMVFGCLLLQTLLPLDNIVSENKIQQCVREMGLYESQMLFF